MTYPFYPESSLRISTRVASTAVPPEDVAFDKLSLPAREGRPLKIAIAGGGVGGLTTALCMLKKGFDVTVYEKTAAFARFGGPIQFASNALSVLKEIDETLFERVMDKFTFTGTRTCGIKDGLRADGSFRMTEDRLDYLWNPDAPADWFVKFPLKVRCNTLQPFTIEAVTRKLTFHFFGIIISSNAPICSVYPTRVSLTVPIYKKFSLTNAANLNPTFSSTAIPS
jgi:hypothetical protein